MIGLFQSSTDAGQWRAQIVRYIVGDLFYFLHQCFDAIEHRVEVFCNVIPFIVRPAKRNTLVQTALHDSATGHVDCLDPSYGATRDQNGGHAGQDEYQGNAPYERRLDASSEGVKVVSIL